MVKRIFLLLPICVFIFFFLTTRFTSAQTLSCYPPTHDCNTFQGDNTPCCPSGGNTYSCKRDFSRGCGRGGCAMTCQKDAVGTTCLDEGQGPCSTNSGTVAGCCPTSVNGPNKGKPLFCPQTNGKCQVATGNNGCVQENNTCGGTSGGCCGLTNSSGQSLQCLNSSGQLVNATIGEQGKCGYSTLQNTQYPVIPPPPSPPCTSYDQTGAGGTGRCMSAATALGDLSTDPSGFITRIFGILIGLSGGIAVILIIIAGYRFMMSQGKPESIQQAREQLIAAIVGLIFLIFSLVILEVIGVDILQIPGTAVTPSAGNGGGPVNNPPPPQNTSECTGKNGGQCMFLGQCATIGGISLGQSDCGGGNECCTSAPTDTPTPTPTPVPQPNPNATGCTGAPNNGACIANGSCATIGGTSLGQQDCGAGFECCK